MKSRMCPFCMWEVKVTHRDEPGDLVICKGCGAEYELRSVNPTRLRPLNFYNGYGEYNRIESDGEDEFHEYMDTY
ncbi:MAG: hypothetical protein K9K37_04070 [Desulfocapsa sp.]|nr:hypothetical protein [Desulfocapsa sp.]